MIIQAMLLVLPVALMAGNTEKGVKYLVECQNKECGYTAEVFFGGFAAVDFAMPGVGMFAGGSYGPATGYCVHCRQFVRGMVYSGTFPGWEKEDDRYLGVVWDSTTGKAHSLFRCPKCERPVMIISNAREVAHCPRCRGAATCRRADKKGETTVPNNASEPNAANSGDDIPTDLVASWGPQADFFRKGGFTIIDWSDAQALLRTKSYRDGKQYHTGWLTIYTVDGRKFLTKQPIIDAFFNFMKQNGLSTQGFATE